MIRRSFKWISAFTLLLAVSVLPAAELTAEIGSGPVYAGIPAEFSISYDGNAMPEPGRMPEVPGLNWVGRSTSRSTRIIGNRASYAVTQTYRFIVEKPGEYTIPAISVRVGGNTQTTRPVTFRATAPRFSPGRSGAPDGGSAPREAVELDKLLFAEISIPEGDRQFYAGEEIPLEVRIYQARNLRCEMSWPEIQTGEKSQILFRDYQKENPENPKFERPRRGQTEIDGRAYFVYFFRTTIRPITFGRLNLTAVANVGIETPRSRRRSGSLFDSFFDDPFFGGSRLVRHAVRASLPQLEIKPLPPRTGDAHFLGLVGKWNVETSLSGTKGRVGEALTLFVDVRGEGSLGTLKAPALEFPGFRVYSPETERNESAGSARIKYILIPTREGVQELKLKFSTFDPSSGKYVEARSEMAVEVEKSAAVFRGSAGPSVIDASAPQEELAPEAPEQRGPTGVLYLKKGPFEEISLPLWRNWIVPGGIVLFAGLAFWIAAELLHLHRRARENDPGRRRRHAAAKRKNELLKRLKQTKPEALPDLNSEIASYVNDCLDLPPGSSLSESAAIAGEENRELGETLRKLSDSSWSFGGSGLNEEFKMKLIKTLSKLVCVGLLFAASALQAAPPDPEKPEKILSPEAAMTAYDEGRFAEAEAYYQSLLRSTAPSAKLYYNIGNCQYQKGEYSRALASYESALRIAPRDSDILENLNLTRRKLALPEKHRLESPADVLPYVRDHLRPDEWMFLVMAGAAVVFVALGFRRFVKPPLWGSLLGGGLILAGLSFAAILAQNATSYNSSLAVVLTRNAPVYALPSTQSPRLSEINLQPGEDVSIVESRLDWVRVRSGAAEGWVRKSDVRTIWDF